MMDAIRVVGNRIMVGDATYRCAIGKAGFTSDKVEGDGCTPLGRFALRECWYRPDRVSPLQTQLPVHAIQPDDGWSDDPQDAQYNCRVKLPPLAEDLSQRESEYSFERLWREDHAYDLIIVLGYNDAPVIPGKGSAIFIHIAKNDYAPTEGCIALAKPDLLAILSLIRPESWVTIQAG